MTKTHGCWVKCKFFKQDIKVYKLDFVFEKVYNRSDV